MTFNQSSTKPAPAQWQWSQSLDLPRDLVGYGLTPPHPQWPNNAKIAVSFVINYEEGGEYSVLNGDAHSETYLTEAVGGTPRQQARNTNVESEYDYGARAGIWRLLKTLGAAGVRGTVYGVGKALEQNPKVAEVLVDMGWEVASHGWRWIDYHDVPAEQERADIEKCIDLITRQTGRAPRGWYIGRLSPRSQALLWDIYMQRDLELLWLSDSYADDLPYYQPLPANSRESFPSEALLVLPYSLDTNDFKYMMGNNWSSPDDFYNYLVAAFDELYAEGADGTPKMMSVGLHARISGRPGRVGAVRRFAEYVRGKGNNNVWVATREEIARHWMSVHPYYPPVPRP